MQPMRPFLRKLTVLVALCSLLAGSWLPGDSAAAADADGICGPALALGANASRVSDDHGPSAQKPHCLVCHWRHTMASASAAAFVAIAGPIEAGRAHAGRPSPEPTTIDAGAAAPRGPPTVS